MPTIIIPTFNGEVPLITPRLLKDTQAMSAINCNLERGHLEPLNAPGWVKNLPGVTRTIYKRKTCPNITDDDGWIASQYDRSIVKSAIYDSEADPLRILYMTMGPDADPTIASAEQPTVTMQCTAENHYLAVPRPTTAPKVMTSTGAIYQNCKCYAWYSTTLSSAPAQYGYTEELDSVEPLPDEAHTASIRPVGGGVALDQRTARSSIYVYTYVVKLQGGVYEMESAPSPASPLVDVIDGDGVKVYGFTLPSATNIEYDDVHAIRLYRTAGTSGDFRFVTELPIDSTTVIANLSYQDDAYDSELSSQVLQTTYWDPIPDDARGIIRTDNGIFAAFHANELLLSEPFYAHAWPTKYRLTVEDDIVVLAHTDNTIIILTKGLPYLASGATPENMQLTKLPVEQSCVSAASAASVAGGVIYASPDGLMLLTTSQQTLLTQEIFTRDQWQTLHPENLMGAVLDNQYIGIFRDTNIGFILNIGAKDIVRVELDADWQVRCLYHDSDDDALYLAVKTPTKANAAYNFIYKWEAGAALDYTWHSKPFFTSALTVMSGIRVEADYSNNQKVNVQFFGPDRTTQRMAATITNNRAKRLKTTRSEKEWSMRLTGKTTVYEIRSGETVETVEHGGQ